MALATEVSISLLCVLLFATSYAQRTAARLSIIDTINLLLSPAGGTSSNQGPSVSLVESWEPVRDSALASGTHQDPALSTAGIPGPRPSSTTSLSGTSSTTSLSGTSGTSGPRSGALVAQLFSSTNAVQPTSTSTSTPTVASNSTSTTAVQLQPLGNDILNQIASVIRLGLQTTSAGNGPTGTWSLEPTHISLESPVQSHALLQVGRRLGDRLHIAQYYDVHGCADPITLFSGPHRMMATVAMARGCNSIQAMQVCTLAQVKKRRGNSHIASHFLPLHIQQQLEGCLSAKVIFNALGSHNGAGSSWGLEGGQAGVQSQPSMAECGLLFSLVMDGGSLDPETMSLTRRQVLPWSCNESTGTTGIPYRVCCPGKVPQPSLIEANVLDGMLNA